MPKGPLAGRKGAWIMPELAGYWPPGGMTTGANPCSPLGPVTGMYTIG